MKSSNSKSSKSSSSKSRSKNAAAFSRAKSVEGIIVASKVTAVTPSENNAGQNSGSNVSNSQGNNESFRRGSTQTFNSGGTAAPAARVSRGFARGLSKQSNFSVASSTSRVPQQTSSQFVDRNSAIATRNSPYYHFEDLNAEEIAQTVAMNKAQNGFPESCEMYTVFWLRGFTPSNFGADRFLGAQFSWRPKVSDKLAFENVVSMAEEKLNRKQRLELLTRLHQTLTMLSPPFLRFILVQIVAFLLIIIAFACLAVYVAGSPDVDGNKPGVGCVLGLVCLGAGFLTMLFGVVLGNRLAKRNRKRDKQVEVNLKQVNHFFKLRENTLLFRSVQQDVSDSYGLRFLRCLGMEPRCRAIIVLHPPVADLEAGRMVTDNWHSQAAPGIPATPPPRGTLDDVDESMNQNIHHDGDVLGNMRSSRRGPNDDRQFSSRDQVLDV